MKVSKALFELGWTPESLPDARDPSFGSVVRTLRSNGVSVEDAAKYLDGALQGDRASLEFVNDNSGAYGMMYFGTQKLWDEGKIRFFEKPQ